MRCAPPLFEHTACVGLRSFSESNCEIARLGSIYLLALQLFLVSLRLSTSCASLAQHRQRSAQHRPTACVRNTYRYSDTSRTRSCSEVLVFPLPVPITRDAPPWCLVARPNPKPSTQQSSSPINSYVCTLFLPDTTPLDAPHAWPLSLRAISSLLTSR